MQLKEIVVAIHLVVLLFRDHLHAQMMEIPEIPEELGERVP
jgi:hypothetical protein